MIQRKPLLILVVSIALIVGGMIALYVLSGRSNAPACNIGMTPGYGVAELDCCWTKIKGNGTEENLTFLYYDLLYPVFYSAVFLCTLVMLRKFRVRSWSVAWIIVPIVALLFSDWIENYYLIHLFTERGKGVAFDSVTAAYSSIATIVKLTIFGIVSIMTIWMAISAHVELKLRSET